MSTATASTTSAADFLPRKITLPTLAAAAKHCEGCDLFRRATQTVFGEGPAGAKVLFVGEQPGDQEDLAGKPFVGPSGAYLSKTLEAVGIDRSSVYVTNAVKHFKWEPRGKRRLHSKPTWRQVLACRPWLMEELRVIAPPIVVCLGATAAQSLLGRDFRLTQHRGKFLPASDYFPDDATGRQVSERVVLATVHPSSLLRIPDRDARHEAQREFTADLASVARRLAGLAAPVRTR